MADGGISATLRDTGRIGLLALRRGQAAGRPVVSPAWFDDTVAGAPDGPEAFREGDGAGPGCPAGAHYRNCWWVTDPELPQYHAAGIHGQSVFVHGPSQTVVAKLSSWPDALSAPCAGSRWPRSARSRKSCPPDRRVCAGHMFLTSPGPEARRRPGGGGSVAA